MMKAGVVENTGGYDAILIKELPIPTAKPNQLVVKNHYSGVNYIDTYHRDGTYPVSLPLTLGREGSGVVTSVGSDVSNDFAVGDRVAYLGSGSYAEYTAANALHVIKLPEQVSLEEGAVSLLQAMTATFLVYDSYPVKRGDYVLVTAAAGGTGGLISQLANALGANVIGLCSTEEKAKIAASNGAHHTIITRVSGDIALQVMELTDKHGVNVIYDGVGKDMYPKTLQCLAKRGRYINFGNAGGVIESVSPFDLTPKCVSFMRPALFSYIETREEFLQLAGRALELISSKTLKIKVHKIYSLEDAPRAHRDLESRGTIGKLILKISD